MLLIKTFDFDDFSLFYQGPASLLQRAGSGCPGRLTTILLTDGPLTAPVIDYLLPLSLVASHRHSLLWSQNRYFGSLLPYLEKDGVQPDLHRRDLGAALVSLCCYLLCGVLYAILALGVAAGQARVLRHVPEVLVPCARREPADDGDGGGVWALRLLPGHPQHGVEDLYHRDRSGLRPPPAGGPHCPHGLLRVRAHLQDGGKSGGRNSVSGR